MEPKYEVVFYGTDRVGDEELEVMQRVGQLLKLDEQQIINLFDQRSGITLLTTRKKSEAEHLVKAMLRTGASCNLRDANLRTEAWESWQLADKEEDVHHVFQCRACNYTERLPVETNVPGVCPECGVVQSKYEGVTQKKLARERVRRKILSVQKAKAKKHEEELERTREEQLRREIEKDIRREMQLHSGLRLDFKSIAAAITIFTIGAGSAIAYYTYSAPVASGTPTIAATTQVINRPAIGMVSTKTVFLADDLLERLGATPPPDAEATTMNRTDRSAFFSDALTDLNTSSEPWNDAPATAAAPVLSAPFDDGSGVRSPPSPGTDAAANASAAIVASWYASLERDPIRHQYLGRLSHHRLDISQHVTAGEIAYIAASPSERVALVAQMTSGEPAYSATSTTEGPVVANDSSVSLEEQAALILARALLRDHPRLAAPHAIDEQLVQLFTPNTKGTLAQVQAQAFIAEVRASNGNLQAAHYWFNRANETLDDIADPGAELLALSRLAVSYEYANDTRTARKLIERVRKGLHSLPKSKQERHIVNALVTTYATLGLTDQAVLTARSTADTTLHADITLADLAAYVAQKGRTISAQGILSVIHDPALRARAKAQISVIAQYLNQPLLGRDFAVAARSDSRGLPSPLAQIVASQLLRAYRAQGIDDASGIKHLATTALSGFDVALADQSRSIIAVNLAWAEEAIAAKQLIEAIAEPSVRQKAAELLQRTEELLSVPTPPTMRTAAN